MSRAIFIGASLALALASFSGIANAQQCRNASGKFIACPTSAAPATRCKDASGKFAKCSAPGAVPGPRVQNRVVIVSSTSRGRPRVLWEGR